MHTVDSIIQQLEALDAKPGRPVIVHSSLRSVGKIEGGGDALLSALIHVFSKDNGLLCVPTHTWEGPMLDMRRPGSCLGALPTIASGRSDGVRTPHPTHSMAVFGQPERVREFVRGEDLVDLPVSPNGCYGKLYHEDGYVLLLGVGHRSNTFLHCAEEMLGVPGRITPEVYERRYIDINGIMQTRIMHGFQSWAMSALNYNKLEPAFRHHGCITEGTVGNAKAQLCSTVKMMRVVELIWKNSGCKDVLTDDKDLDPKLYTQDVIL